MPTAVSVWNSLGKEQKIGATNYFGLSLPDPNRAPTNFMNLPAGDTDNLAPGTSWTLQGIILNPVATSPKRGSVTNAIAMLML